jgi:hypothetical protein
MAGIFALSTPAQAAIVLNPGVGGATLNFDEGVRTRVVYAGPTGSTTMGTTQGSIVAYRGVTTINSTVVDAVIETVTVSSATISKFDGGSAVNNDAYFQSDISTTNAGSVLYKFSFFVGGTYTGASTGTPVILQNVYINSYDLDASQAGNNQYTQFTGVQAYTMSNNTTLGVSSSGNLLQFINTNTGANYSDSNGSYTKGRVQVKYDNLSTINIKVGTDAAASGGTNYYALDFSVGLPWTEGSTTIGTTTTTNNFNAPPTSTNDTKTVASQTATVLTDADFGTYADPDFNPWVAIQVSTLPAGGVLQFYNGSSWITVTGGQTISVADIDAGYLRYTSNAPTSSDSFTFKVSDGLLTSTSSYTLALTVTGGGQVQSVQMITFAQPADQLRNNNTLTVAPTASSALTVTLTSTTTGVCTVSGFVITFVSLGNCSITASQAGDSNYSAATDVVRTFAITNPQTITFTQPVDQLLSAASLTVAPTASSNLTVTLTSTTTGICTVSGFVVTFVANGTCSLTTSQAGNSTYSPATNVIRSFVISTPGVNTPVTLPPAPDIDPISGVTRATNPITLPIPVNRGTSGANCLIDPADTFCKQTVTVRGKGTFTLLADGKTTFKAVTGFFGSVSVQYRVTDGFAQFDLAPATVEVLKPLPSTLPPTAGSTLVNKPVKLYPAANLFGNGKGSMCLVDPADNVCKQKVTLPGKGTFTLNSDGSVDFSPEAGFLGEATVQLRITDELGASLEAPVTVRVTDEPGTENGSTKGTTPVILTPETPLEKGGQVCLIDPNDNACKTVVKVAGVGTWTQAKDGSVKFVAVAGYTGNTTVMQRFTRASMPSKFKPFSVSVSKTRGPVTITISGFADGSPVLTAAIKAKINAFLRAHADYKNVFCIGYTEGPTVLKTDAALSKARAVNGCTYVKTGLGKKLILKNLSASQGTVEADKFRRITITLTD